MNSDILSKIYQNTFTPKTCSTSRAAIMAMKYNSSALKLRGKRGQLSSKRIQYIHLDTAHSSENALTRLTYHRLLNQFQTEFTQEEHKLWRGLDSSSVSLVGGNDTQMSPRGRNQVIQSNWTDGPKGAWSNHDLSPTPDEGHCASP